MIRCSRAAHRAGRIVGQALDVSCSAPPIESRPNADWSRRTSSRSTTGGNLQRRQIARAIGHRAVGDFQQRFQQRRAVVFRWATSVALSKLQVCSERSKRRPMSRKRQACVRVMLSMPKPLNAARLMTTWLSSVSTSPD